MAEQRIDDLYDLSAIEAQQKATQALIAKTVADIKKAKELSIDFNINTKSIADYNKKIKELELQLNKVQRSTDAVTKSSILLARQKEAEAKAAIAVTKQTQAEAKAKEANIKVVYDSAKAKQVEEAVTKNLIKEQEKLNKQLSAENKALADATNDYMQLSRAYNDAALKAKNYALQLGEAHPITVQAVADAKVMGDTLKRLDATVGQHQRNVGNYTQATFALTQVLREAPAFANSFATGISAIGNNVPMLIDQFKILRSEVGSNFKALKILGASMLSFTGLLPIGFLLLQSFSKEFINFIGGLTGSADAAEKSAAALEKYNNTIETGRARVTALAEAIQFLNTVGRINLEIDFGEGFELKDLQAQSVGVATQVAAVRDELQKLSVESDKAFQKYMDGTILEKDYQKIVEADTKRRKELQEQETKLSREQIIAYRQIALERVKIDRERTKKIKDMSEQERKDALELFKFNMQLLIEEQKARVAIGQGGTRDTARRKQADLERELITGVAEFEVAEKNITRSKIKLIEAKKNEDIKISNRERLLDIMGFAQAEREALVLSAEETGNALTEQEAENQKKIQAEKERLKQLEINNLLDSFLTVQRNIEEDTSRALKAETDRYKVSRDNKEVHETNKLKIENKGRRDSIEAEIKYYENLILISDLGTEEQKKAIQALHDLRIKLRAEDIKDAEKAKEKRIDIERARNAALKDLSIELSGLVFDLFQNAIERQKNAVQDQIDLLEQQKQKDIEVANQTITNAQDRADAIAVIEARAAAKRQQLELRQRQLDQQKARFEKANAVTRIIQETGIAVMSSFKTDPTGILALVIGAIGAAQLVRVLAQPIPKYAEGTDYHPGGKAVVGDGGRSEGVVMPDGSVYRTPSTSTVVDLPEGAKVFPDYSKMMMNATMTKVPVFNIKTVDNTSATMEKVGRNIVRAVKSIPQPHLTTDGAWSKAMKTGSNFRTYLNKNL